jgi:hypothetical protein
MRSFRNVLAILLVSIAGLTTTVPARASLGTNFSDQWWNPNESGWGASVLQQYDTLFIDLFVYDQGTRPTWFTAAAFYQPDAGRSLFVGDLYVSTTGPWYVGFFNPLAVMQRKVGTIQFDASSTDFATLTYTVDGAVITKAVQRQLWTYEDFSGNYYGGFVYDQSNCVNPSDNGHVEELGAFQINHPIDNSFTLTLQSQFGSCTAAGNYSQLGHMGTVDASYSCTYGVTGTMTLFELERTGPGMTGRFVADNNLCFAAGKLGGVER